MMRGGQHPSPTVAPQTWPLQPVNSLMSGSHLGNPLIKQIDKKVLPKKAVLNGIHSESNCIAKTNANSKLHKGIVITSSASLLTKDSGALKETVIGINKEVTSAPQSKIQWTTTRHIVAKDASAGISNLNSWLTSPKRDEDKCQNSTTLTNGNATTYHGFDLTKLYPELSAKLGLTKSSEGNQKSSSKFSHLKESSLNLNCTHSKSTNPSKSVNVNFKKLLAKSHLKSSSSISYLKSNNSKANSNLLKCTSSSIINVEKDIPEKPKDFKQTPTKFYNDKLAKVVVNQSNYKRPSLTNKKDTKLWNRKTKNQNNSSDKKCDNLYDDHGDYPMSGSFQKPISVSFLPQRSSFSLPKHKTLSPLQLRVHKLYQENYAYKSDLFPLGLESSGCDNLCEDVVSTKNFTSLPECLYSEKEAILSDPSYTQTLGYSVSTQRRQVIMAKERLKVHEQNLNERWSFTRALLEAARENPYQTASTLSTFINKSPDLSFAKKKLRKCQNALLVKHNCAYEFEEGKECGQRALPGTRHCTRHITYNVDQQLFSQCSARLENNSLCRIPTFDVLHESPLCQMHGSQKMETAESTEVLQPKMKRPRKKSKMPVLSRYGKRSKKRWKTSSIGASTVIPSTSVRPPINSPGVCLGSPQGTSPITPRTSPSFSTSGKADESDFEDEFGGMIGGLPLDAASRFLEDPGDLQDVLNKIPEEEISQIFYDTETKTEDCVNEVEMQLETKSSDDASSALLTGHSDITSCSQPLQNSEQTLSLPFDVSTLSEMATNGTIDSIISSSFNQQELNAISQVLSNMVQDESLNLDAFQLVDNNQSHTFDDSISRVENELKAETLGAESPLSENDDRRKFSSENSAISDCKMSIFKQTNKLKVDTPPLQTLQ